MLTILIHFVIVAVAMLVVANFMKGIEVRDFGSAFIAAVVLGAANAFLKPVLLFLSAPINWLTLGLFTFVINGVLLKLVAELIDGVKVKDWLSAIVGAFLISVISSVMSWVLVW